VTPDQIEAERVAFEAYVTTSRYQSGLARIGDTYASPSTFDRWHAWLARAELANAERVAAEEYEEFREANKWERRE
jgi:hypothetical protein